MNTRPASACTFIVGPHQRPLLATALLLKQARFDVTVATYGRPRTLPVLLLFAVVFGVGFGQFVHLLIVARYVAHRVPPTCTHSLAGQGTRWSDGFAAPTARSWVPTCIRTAACMYAMNEVDVQLAHGQSACVAFILGVRLRNACACGDR